MNNYRRQKFALSSQALGFRHLNKLPIRIRLLFLLRSGVIFPLRPPTLCCTKYKTLVPPLGFYFFLSAWLYLLHSFRRRLFEWTIKERKSLLAHFLIVSPACPPATRFANFSLASRKISSPLQHSPTFSITLFALLKTQSVSIFFCDYSLLGCFLVWWLLHFKNTAR